MSNLCFSICPKVCVLGDSTVINHWIFLPQYHYCRIVSDATSGDRIANSKAGWLALSETVRLSFDYVLVQIGLNDCNDSSLITNYQDLINTINLSIKSDCRVIGVAMTPCRAAKPVADYGRWVQLNDAIRQISGNITGLFDHVDSHLSVMGDENNNLLALYDSGDGLHPNILGNKVNCEEIAKIMI